LAQDREGSLWLATSSGLVRRLPDGRSVGYRAPAFGGVLRTQARSVLVDREGRIWVGYEVGLMVLKPESAQLAATIRGLAEPVPACGAARHPGTPGLAAPCALAFAGTYWGRNVRALRQARDGRVWIGAISGLTEFDGKRFRTYDQRHGLVDETVNALLEDRDDNLWLATDAAGAIKLASNGFVTFRANDGLLSSYVTSLLKDRRGAVLAVPGSRLALARFDGERFKSTPLRLNLPPGSLGARLELVQDRAGEWWIASPRGLHRYGASSPHGVAVVPKLSPGLPGPGVDTVFEDAVGDLWISGALPSRRWLVRYDRAHNVFTPQAPPLPLSPRDELVHATDLHHQVWLGLAEAGLARWREGRFTALTAADGLPQHPVSALHVDGHGRLWVGTLGGGLVRLDDTRSEHPRIAPGPVAGLASQAIRCLTEDDWGRIYVGTARGIDRLEPETGLIKHYTTADGLATNETTVALRDGIGGLWFATLDGLSRIQPRLEAARPQPVVRIAALRAGGSQWPVAELGQPEIGPLRLAAGESQLQVDFFALDFEPGSSLRYQYRLEGDELDWSQPSEHRSVRYGGLAPGAYRLLVRAVDTSGRVSAQPAVVSLQILPPFWRRPPFLALLAGLVVAAVYLAHRFRLQRALHLERIRTRIAADLHDDIGANLSTIALLSDVAQRQAEDAPAALTSALSRIGEIGRRSVEAMSDIVWAIDPSKDRLGDLVSRMRRFASDAFTAGAIEFRFEIAGADHDLALGTAFRREVLLIFKEAVNNVVRHAGCSQARVSFRAGGRRLELTVIDDGRGFDVDGAGEGNGLASMRRRALALGGQIEIVSGPGKGTRLLLAVPVTGPR
jgi:signal transduction histidine kinase/streptogramin lyase